MLSKGLLALGRVVATPNLSSRPHKRTVRVSFLPFLNHPCRTYLNRKDSRRLTLRRRLQASTMTDQIKIRLDEFAFRQFDDPTYLGTQVPTDKDAFMKHLREVLKSDKPALADGYAPFCKHIFVKNWVPGVLVGAIAITPENQHLLQSGYKARTEKELPVLCRWFAKDQVSIPQATVLDLILYSREQVTKECQAMGNPIPTEDYDWALIAVKGQTEGAQL